MDEKTVYIDVLFATNVIIDYFLLLITAKFSFTACRRLRLFAGALLGGLFAALLFFWPYASAYTPLVQVIVCVAVCGVAFNKPQPRDLIRLSLVFFAVTLCFGGVIFALAYFCNPRGLFQIRAGVPYINLPFTMLLFGTCVAYGLLGLVFGSASMRKKSRLVKIEVSFASETLEISAMQDTGNLLRDATTCKKVIILNKEVVVSALNQELREVLQGLDGANAVEIMTQIPQSEIRRFVLVPYASVSGSALMLAIKPDALVVDGKASSDYIIGISAQELCLGTGSNAIINV